MPSPTEKLSDAIVRKLPTPPSGNKITYDGEVKGFGCRVTAAGAKAFIVNYRAAGRERRFTIGSYPDWSVNAARDEAKRLKREVDQGRDPMAERTTEREAPTVNRLCDLYIERHLPKKRPLSQRDDLAFIEKEIRPELGSLKVANVRHADIDDLHRKVGKRAPVRANRLAALLSKMFSLAIKWELRTDNPAKGIERNPENRRERYLSPVEIARLSAALTAHPEQASANVVRLLLLTGARRGEMFAATWEQFDIEAGVWTKPSAHTKQKKEHRVPLSAPARQLLQEIRPADAEPSDPVFVGRVLPPLKPGGKPRKMPLTDIKKFWAAICDAAEIEGCRLHDLRHSYASILASAGLSLPIVGALLGHTQPGTTARYAHLYDDPLRAATERVGAVFMPKGEGAEIVRLKGGA